METNKNSIKDQVQDKVLSTNQQILIDSYKDVISKNENLKKLLETNPMKLAERLATFNFESSLKNNFLTRAFYDPTDIKSIYLRNAAIAWVSGNREAYEEHMRALHEKLMRESEDGYKEFELHAEKLPPGPLRTLIHLFGLFTTMPEDIGKVLAVHTRLAFFKLAAKHRDFDRELNLAVDHPDAFQLVHAIATIPKNMKLKQILDSLDDESKKAILTVCDTFQSMLDRAPKHIKKQISDFKDENQHLIQSQCQELPQQNPTV